MPGISRRRFLAAAAASPLARAQRPTVVYVAPNFHPASCGWLTNFSKERVYCANSYFDHLDRVRDDPNYRFALSEVNNLIAMMNFRPDRTAELKQRIQEGRVELVNAFFLESTINLSGGEALVRLGVEGLRWQERVFGVRPRIAWNIDVCGTHAQMAQIAAGLGLEALVYCRKNPTGKSVHWAESPDGTQVLALSPGHYSELRPVMAATGPLGEKEMAEVDQAIEQKRRITPEGLPILILAGSADYALAPARKENPSAFLREWKAQRPNVEFRFATPGQYLDAIKKQSLDIPVMHGGTEYDFHSFWIENPRVKTWFRECEHALQSAESVASAASLEARYTYPVETLHNAWLQMFLNMDRNTLWGAAGGMVFEHERSWDVRDRFQWVERESRAALHAATVAMLKKGSGVAVVNTANWARVDPFFVPAGTVLPEGANAHTEGDRILCRVSTRAGSAVSKPAAKAAPVAARAVAAKDVIETDRYKVRLDPGTGALMSLMLNESRELLGGQANVIVAERPVKQQGDPGDHMLPRSGRNRLGSSSETGVEISAWEGIATVVEVRGTLLGQPCRRRMWFYKNFPRIDFETELNDVPDRTVVVAEFPLASRVTQMRRGIPYGFADGRIAGIAPAVRWSHYQLEMGGSLAILDHGLSGRELAGRTALLYLLNATDKYYGYPNPWLSGKGKHVLRYALVPHSADWRAALIPQMAWEFNAPPVLVPGCAPDAAVDWLEASGNVIVESLRRVGSDVEVRLAECLGLEGAAEVALKLWHREVWVTDLAGRDPHVVDRQDRYKFPIRPQQILTLRFRTAGNGVPEPKPVMEWDALVPAAKRPALHEYTQDKGHPPRGT
jgi:alpha-mannosidase